MLVKIRELRNEPETAAWVKEALRRLAGDHGQKGRDKAFVDVDLHPPDSRMDLPGTKRCEGNESKERTFRLITVDGSGGPCQGLDLAAFAEAVRPSRGGAAGTAPAGGALCTPPGGPRRPTILVTTEEFEVNDRAVEALAADPTVYQRTFSNW